MLWMKNQFLVLHGVDLKSSFVLLWLVLYFRWKWHNLLCGFCCILVCVNHDLTVMRSHNLMFFLKIVRLVHVLQRSHGLCIVDHWGWGRDLLWLFVFIDDWLERWNKCRLVHQSFTLWICAHSFKVLPRHFNNARPYNSFIAFYS